MIVSQPFPLQNHYTYNPPLVGLSTMKMKNVSPSSRKTIDWNLIILWIPVDLKRSKPIIKVIISLTTKIWRSNTGCYFRKFHSMSGKNFSTWLMGWGIFSKVWNSSWKSSDVVIITMWMWAAILPRTPSAPPSPKSPLFPSASFCPQLSSDVSLLQQLRRWLKLI